MSLEMQLTILRGRNNELVGFQVVPGPDTESDLFIQEFIPAICARERTGADIIVKDDQLLLINPKSRSQRECAISLSPEDARELDDMLEVRGRFVGMEFTISSYVAHSLTEGFRIRAKV